MKKAIILTHPLQLNYGGLLQAFALQKVVERMGVDVVTDKNACQRYSGNGKFTKYAKNVVKTVLNLFGKRYVTISQLKTISQNTDRFIRNYIKTTDFFKGKNIPPQKVISKYDIFIVGSDQIWRKKFMNVQAYFLNFIRYDDTKTKIAYAGSFGTDNLSEWTQEDIDTCKKLAPKFNAISVREDSGANIFDKYFNIRVPQVLDPTMLLNREDYLDVIETVDKKHREKVLLCYMLNNTDPKKIELIQYVADKMSLNPMFVMPEEDLTPHTENIQKCIYPSVSHWLSGFRDAEFVLTDSFHGTVFSIIFNKQFVCIDSVSRGSARFASLLKMFNLEDRLINSPHDFNEDLITKKIDYEAVNVIMENMKKKSFDFLKKALQ